MPCPHDGFAHRTGDYIAYKDRIRGNVHFTEEDDQEGMGSIFERIQGLVLGIKAQEGVLCAICQEPINQQIKEESGDTEEHMLGQGVQLPCYHFFHLTCLTKWISPGKTECPCCRQSI